MSERQKPYVRRFSVLELHVTPTRGPGGMPDWTSDLAPPSMFDIASAVAQVPAQRKRRLGNLVVGEITLEKDVARVDEMSDTRMTEQLVVRLTTKKSVRETFLHAIGALGAVADTYDYIRVREIENAEVDESLSTARVAITDLDMIVMLSPSIRLTAGPVRASGPEEHVFAAMRQALRSELRSRKNGK